MSIEGVNLERLSLPEAPSELSGVVAVMQFGSQHTLEIVDAIRAQGVDAREVPFTTPATELSAYAGIVLSGGDGSVYAPDAPKPDPDLYNLKKPILGICYGAQLLAHDNGGLVEPGSQSEFGQHTVMRQNADTSIVFTTQETEQRVWMNHGDRIQAAPEGFVVDAVSEGGMIAAFRSRDNQQIGLQFHPEVIGEGRTEQGSDIWARFLFDVAHIEPTFRPDDLETRVQKLQEEVGAKTVLAFLSGGVDSTVMAALLGKAVPPEQVVAVHIDHDFMRQDESDGVVTGLAEAGVEVRVYDASEFFLNATTVIDGVETAPLRDTTSPEVKRKIIGDSFIRFQEVAAKELGLPQDYVLAQGSIRPDLIESGSRGTTTIKSHHNDSPLARILRADGRLVEPLQDLYKPGVRALGRVLELPDSLVERQPFPGPGLAIRILCARGNEVTPEAIAALEATFEEVGRFATTTTSVTVIPVRSVGQRGESRAYGQTVVLSGEPDWQNLMKLAREIPQAARDVTRVTYAFGDQINASVSTLLTPTFLGHDTAEQLRHADAIVRDELTAADLDIRLQQVPVILIPTGVDVAKKRSVVLRPFLTSNFMTGVPAIPGSEDMPLDVLSKIVTRLSAAVPGISRIMYDLTSKPPGTTEWE